MRILALLLVAILSPAFPARAQAFDFKVESRSGQFIVRGPAPSTVPFHSTVSKAADPVTLDTGVLAVSCERIKEALLRTLGIRETWRVSRDFSGLIYVNIHSGKNLRPHIRAVHHLRGWDYQVDLPPVIEPDRLSEAIIDVLLLEIGNRGNTGSNIELPRWLRAGLNAELRDSSLQSLHAVGGRTREAVHLPERELRRQLEGKQLLSFEELSWPDDLDDDRYAVYQQSAHLFVAQLLKLDRGRECLRRTIEELARYRNWQFALLNGFNPHFKQLVDVEKWWALRLVTFTGRDGAHNLSRAESWQKLDAILRIPVEGKNGVTAGRRTEIDLQRALEYLDLPAQRATVQEVIGRLAVLQVRAAPDARPAIADYRGALENYLRKLEPRRFPRRADPDGAALLRARVEAQERLEQLDGERNVLRQKQSVTAR